VLVRFRPAGYVAPTRVGHDLSPLQRELLEVLAVTGPTSLPKLRAVLQTRAADRTIRENLAILRHLGLVDSTGQTRGVRWMLKGAAR
jgi:ATP-dependent DNA helicase RecG